jgi:hypothetical protein
MAITDAAKKFEDLFRPGMTPAAWAQLADAAERARVANSAADLGANHFFMGALELGWADGLIVEATTRLSVP